MAVKRIERFQLNSADPEGLAQFFINALGFVRGAGQPDRPSAISLTLGRSCLVLDLANGGNYPGDIQGWDPRFQHFAIDTRDMSSAFRRLQDFPGWCAISTNGPEHLPQRSGGVVAFKFRDPESHPLELISFPRENSSPNAKIAGQFGPFVEIDHSAISVANVDRSIEFYSRLGFRAGPRSLNSGVEQQRLDGIAGACVDVVELDLSGEGPHLELLHYRGKYDRRQPPPSITDIAATRTVMTVADATVLAAVRLTCSSETVKSVEDGLLLRDPDGHLVEIWCDT
jgi:catechol 2,3-dioxygenase-like lactoylglutathione lyase family enzyme